MRASIVLLALLTSALLFIGTYTVVPVDSEATDQDASVMTAVEDVTDVTTFSVTPGKDTYREFVVDNVLHTAKFGDVHYSILVPETYDETRPTALFVTLPGEPGLYYQGVGENLLVEEFAYTAQEYDENMIIAAVQPNSWDQASADQVIALTEYLIYAYNIDPNRVYLEGYSYGGETLSLVMGTKPELYSAALHCSSQWDGDPEVLAAARVPVHIALGNKDEFYSASAARSFAEKMRALYRAQGLEEDEIDQLVVLDIKGASYFAGSDGSQHNSSCALMAHDSKLMGWLFSQ